MSKKSCPFFQSESTLEIVQDYLDIHTYINGMTWMRFFTGKFKHSFFIKWLNSKQFGLGGEIGNLTSLRHLPSFRTDVKSEFLFRKDLFHTVYGHEKIFHIKNHERKYCWAVYNAALLLLYRPVLNFHLFKANFYTISHKDGEVLKSSQ